MKFPEHWSIQNNEVPIIDVRTKLPVNKKYTWITRNGVRNLKNITTIVVHHDAISKSSTKQYNDTTLASRIATSHINSPHNIPGGDPGFPYHAWVRNGNVYVCNDLEALTYGVANNNSYTLHISVSGNYAGVDTLEPRDRYALYAAILMVKELVPTADIIKAHKEITNTACPGFDINQVRNDILHIEEQLSAVEDSKPVRAYAVVSRMNQLLTRVKDPKWGYSATQKLNWLIPLQPDCDTPDGLVKAVMGYYNGKDYDAVLVFEEVMKERSLL